MNYPSRNYKIVHVTGTNGKGSTSLNIAKDLQKAGYKVGLFSSPHINSYHERISINGELISEESIQRICVENKNLFKDLVFFNLMMFIAFLHFSKQEVDYAIIEVGVGGLFDSTNIVNPVISVITNIDLDHSEFLGDTLDSVAINKAGIIKENTPVVLGYHARHKACFTRAKQMRSPVLEIQTPFDDYFEENKAIANKVLEALNIAPSNSYCHLPARFEERGNYIFDMAHNIHGVNALKKMVLKKHPSKSIIAIWNMLKDKDVAQYLEVLESFTDNIYHFAHSNQRLLSGQDAKEIGVDPYRKEKADIYLVCGSIYFIDAAKKSL